MTNRHWKYNVCLTDLRPFSKAEDVVIVEGVKMGFEIKDIAMLLGNRATIQCQRRYRQLAAQPKAQLTNWTEAEDELMLSFDDPFHLNQNKYRLMFPKRTLAQIVSRYHFLRMKLTDPTKYVENLKVKYIKTKDIHFYWVCSLCWPCRLGNVADQTR